eukprot:jgi/Chrzof1/5560/Cz16g07170.t1
MGGAEDCTGSPEAEDITLKHKPYRLPEDKQQGDWVSKLDLQYLRAYCPNNNTAPPKILVLYGSLRERSYSKLLSYEFARILEFLGCDVRVYDPRGLPMKDETSDDHPKVQELRQLSTWSEGHVWCCPEQHGTISGVFKNQVDWIPLSLGSVRPTQGRTLCIAQVTVMKLQSCRMNAFPVHAAVCFWDAFALAAAVTDYHQAADVAAAAAAAAAAPAMGVVCLNRVNGGSQSFNVVNTLRVLGRWMRMNTITNQSSIPKAWTEFDEEGRLKDNAYRDRVVDVAEEMFKWTMLLRDHSDFLVDRYSERKEKGVHGRLLSQAEKEEKKIAAQVV